MNLGSFLNDLEKLSAAPGIPGFEGPVARLLRECLEDPGITTRMDNVGNLVAHIPGNGPRVLLVAHMDEPGYLVRKILPGGFLRLERVGGAAWNTLAGQHVQVWAQAGVVPGVVGMIPPHIAPGGVQDLNNLFVDLGVCSLEQAQALGIEIGTPVTCLPRFQVMRDMVWANSLDDRAGCALLVQLAQELVHGAPLHCDLTLAFVVQEENLLVGGQPVVYELRPDYVIGLDATLTYDTPDLNNAYSDVGLGKGPAIKIMDHIRGRGQGFISHTGLRQHIESVARDSNIPLQREIAVGISTAVAPLPFVGTGFPVAAVSFPLRYSHSPAEAASLTDLELTLRLLLELMQHPWLPES